MDLPSISNTSVWIGAEDKSPTGVVFQLQDWHDVPRIVQLSEWPSIGGYCRVWIRPEELSRYGYGTTPEEARVAYLDYAVNRRKEALVALTLAEQQIERSSEIVRRCSLDCTIEPPREPPTLYSVS